MIHTKSLHDTQKKIPKICSSSAFVGYVISDSKNFYFDDKAAALSQSKIQKIVEKVSHNFIAVFASVNFEN